MPQPGIKSGHGFVHTHMYRCTHVVLHVDTNTYIHTPTHIYMYMCVFMYRGTATRTRADRDSHEEKHGDTDIYTETDRQTNRQNKMD